MDSRSLRTLQWRAAAPSTRPARLAPFKTMVAFVVDQVLLFWPLYRDEYDCDCGKPDVPAGVTDEPAN